MCAVPWLVVVGSYMEACVVRLVLSRWPRPMFDDPKQLATAPLHLVFQLLLLSLGAVIPFPIVFALWSWDKILKDWRYSVRIGAFAVGLLAIWFVAHYDPGRVWD
jgi:hypothetical protein